MNDREFLIWIHERLQHVHGENPLTDYMHKLRVIILGTDPLRETANVDTYNSIEEIKGWV